MAGVVRGGIRSSVARFSPSESGENLQSGRRNALLTLGMASSAMMMQGWSGRAGAVEADGAQVPPPPPTGDCADCIGLDSSGQALSACRFEQESCASTFNDDSEHFVPPWQYSQSRDEAMTKLLAVATSQVPYRITLPAGSLLALTGLTERERVFAGELEAFSVAEGYIRVALGNGLETPRYDAEFFFPQDDSIVLLRAAAREGGRRDAARIRVSLESGLTVSRNGAREVLEDLRKAVGWEPVPVMMANDPKYNGEVRLPFERFLDAFRFWTEQRR